MEPLSKKIRVIVTGATGMVGEGVMHECLQHPDVEAVLVINRRPDGVVHPKLKEIVHENFFDLSPIEDQLKGYNACYFCLGVTSIGKKEPEYYNLTHTLTMHVAETLVKHNPDMVFVYVSGSGTDSTEKGSTMWARVKGKTENDLMKLPFKDVYAFRPGFMKPIEGLKHVQKGYTYLGWLLYPIFKVFLPNGIGTLRDTALAMIYVTLYGSTNKIVTPNDMKVMAKSVS